jgi:rod shape-determining protein MreC
MRITSPIWKGQNFVSNSIRYSAEMFRSKRSLAIENANLKKRIMSYDEIIMNARATNDKYEELLSVFGRDIRNVGIPATVLIHPPETAYDILVLDAGSNLGVSENDLVSTPDGVALGRVSEVFDHTSKMRLFTSSTVQTNAVLERDSVSISLLGQGGGNFKIILPRDMDVQAGDRILTSGLDSSLIAVVSSITQKPTDAFKEVLATTPINIYTHRYVVISHE